MKQHEMVIGSDWALTPQLAFETRYSRKRLDRTIEDTGVITPNGEQYYISNPGEGTDSAVPSYECTTCPINPKANRRYDGVEFRLTKRPGSSRWFGSFSYTYSRLYGNYSGLTATDISDGGGARNGANTDRAFDEAYMQFDSHGKIIDGPLGTDRPHSFKAFGYYRLKWLHMETLLGGFQQWYSGTPLSSYVSIWGAPVFVEGRGNFVDVTRDTSGWGGDWVKGSVHESRTPAFSQTDLSLVQEFHVSKSNEKLMVAFEANAFNIFNQHSVTYVNSNLIRSGQLSPYGCTFDKVQGIYLPPCLATSQSGFDYGSVMAGYDYTAEANAEASPASPILNSTYGMPYGWQGARSFRFKFRFNF
jgi:hypothetical protein